MARRARKSKPAGDRLVRVYETLVWPLTESGERDPDGPYEKRTITLGYPVDEAPDDLYTDRAQRESLKQFLKDDGWTKDELPVGMASHELVEYRYKGAHLKKAAETYEAGAPRPVNVERQLDTIDGLLDQLQAMQ